jgi:polysaccharide pyruvyl transferase WcaK-like protein
VFFVSNRWVAVLVAAVFFAVAFLILYQQKVTFGLWFQVSDLHHETFAIASAALGIGVLIGAALNASDPQES